ncbi:hypothetical protein [Bifidobacterium aerophilum]|uniref:Uncharacterized protein n=1 Tax=Bifidobacterium aerophilum TaxID=1798155 RepID=A0A6N9Z6M5_9BIFI|nr:hypothetical protein [Bifidobacterium aerophilum]NEG90367.1 hypothetical protein [Bifidobacterium aerophilum]
MKDDQMPWDADAGVGRDGSGRGDPAAAGKTGPVGRRNPYVVDDDVPSVNDTADVEDDAENDIADADDLSEAIAAETVRRMRMPRWLALLIAVIVVVAGAGGFMFHRARQGGSAVNCSASSDIDYCYGGFTPLEPSGDKLSMNAASDYFDTAVRPVYPADAALRTAILSGDLDAVHKAAATARDTTLRAARTLAARTWPDQLDKPIRGAIIEYQHRASIYGNVITNTDREAIEDLIFRTLSATRASSDIQRLVRTRLELDAVPEPDAPLAVTAVKDAGECQQLALIGDDDRTVTRRCVTLTVVSHVPANVPYLAMRLNLLDADGTTVATDLLASTPADVDDPNYIHDDGTVTLTVGINPRIVRSGYRLAASGWSVHTADDLIISDDYTATQAAAITPLNEFRIA